MVIFGPYFKVVVKPQFISHLFIISKSLSRFDNDFEVRLKYYCLQLSCFYLNLKSSRCCFSEFVSCSISLNCQLVMATYKNHHFSS